MQCPACGAFIGEDDAFCGECGRPVDRKPQPPTPSASARPPAPPLFTPTAQPQPSRSPAKRIAPALILVGIGLSLTILSLGGIIFTSLRSREPKTPTEVATPLPTDTPTAEPTRGPLRDLRSLIVPEPVYSDDFSNPASGWETFEDEDTKTEYADGGLRISIYTENYMAWSNPYPPLALSNLAVEVDARLVEGPLDNNFGLLVHHDEGIGEEPEDFYWYEISSDGYYSVVLRRDEEWMTLIPWQESEAINQGVDVLNHLQVLCAGSLCSFYVNDTWLTDVIDSTILSGTIGLAAGNFDEPGTVIQFDNLVVYELEE